MTCTLSSSFLVSYSLFGQNAKRFLKIGSVREIKIIDNNYEFVN